MECLSDNPSTQLPSGETTFLREILSGSVRAKNLNRIKNLNVCDEWHGNVHSDILERGKNNDF